jgi:hypothetical protein
MNTGFGEGQELHYDTPCKKPELKTPLYRDNCLSEFVTEEEKAAVRKAIGIYTKGDVMTDGLLTITEDKPSMQDLIRASTQQLKKADQFFAPITITKAVFDEEGNSLNQIIQTIKDNVKANQVSITNIIQESNSKTITSLGDVKKFLRGFNNGDNLHDTLTTIDKEMLRFEKLEIF